MRANGWRGVVRVEKVRTTVADPAAVRAPDLVDRQFRVPAPNLLVVADFTYVRLTSGAFAYTAFVIDEIVGVDLQDASDRLLLELQLTLRRRKEDAAPR